MSLFFKKMSNLKVIFVIDSLVVGGAESQLVMLARELHSRGYHCLVFALRAEGALLQTLESVGIPVKNGKFAKGRDRFALLRGVWYLWQTIRKNRPCVVQAYLPLSNFLGSIVARLAGASVVVTSRRGLGQHQDWGRRWKYFDRISNALSSKITVNSQAVGKDTISRDCVDSRKIICINNGLDFSRFNLPANMRELMRRNLGLSNCEFAWVKVANLVDYKGHMDLVQAFSALSESCATRLFLVGRDRGFQANLEEIVAKLEIADRVVFLGNRNDVPEILSAMDGYVMASHSEGFSNAILEAMAAGLPIVATNVGGNSEALKDGSLGILVPAHNPLALTAAMQKLMSNKAQREEFAIAAKKNVNENYSVKVMVDAYIKIYQSGLQN
jgi:glycosyltransferase involved in cell wall biosynthesis